MAAVQKSWHSNKWNDLSLIACVFLNFSFQQRTKSLKRSCLTWRAPGGKWRLSCRTRSGIWRRSWRTPTRASQNSSGEVEHLLRFAFRIELHYLEFVRCSTSLILIMKYNPVYSSVSAGSLIECPDVVWVFSVDRNNAVWYLTTSQLTEAVSGAILIAAAGLRDIKSDILSICPYRAALVET